MKQGDIVMVDRCFFAERFSRGEPFLPFRVPCNVIKDEFSICKRSDCRSTCKGVAVWVRKPGAQADWENLRAKGFAGASWNYDAYKVCTSYIHTEKSMSNHDYEDDGPGPSDITGATSREREKKQKANAGDAIMPRHGFSVVVESKPPMSRQAIEALLNAGLVLKGTPLRIIEVES